MWLSLYITGLYLVVSYVTANAEKVLFSYKDHNEWHSDSKNDLAFGGFELSSGIDIHWLTAPKDAHMLLKINDYLDKLPVSQMFILTNLTYGQNYELRICYPASTPADIGFDTMTTKNMVMLSTNNNENHTLVHTDFLASVKEALAVASEENYSIVVKLYIYNNAVLVPYTDSTESIDFVYQIILEPLYFKVVPYSARDLVIFIVFGFILCLFQGIPRFNRLLHETVSELDQLHED